MKDLAPTIENSIQSGLNKVNTSLSSQIVLGILAGIFIALAASSSSAAVYSIESIGLSKVISGAIFATGIMLVVLTKAQLFTGNILSIVSTLAGSMGKKLLVKSWALIYISNFIGAIIIVIFISLSGQLNGSEGALGAYTIKVAVHKVSLPFISALVLGILCNILVCSGIWMSMTTTDTAGKILALFFPILIFIVSGFEHCVANMYYIPAGLIAKMNPQYVQQAISMGITQGQLDGLNIGSFLLNNMLPVTIGNIIGGGFFIGFAFWFAHHKGEEFEVRKQKKMSMKPKDE